MKVLRGKQREESIINIKLISIHPLIRTYKGPDIFLELANARNIGS